MDKIMRQIILFSNLLIINIPDEVHLEMHCAH